MCKRFAIQTLLWSLEFVIQINIEHDTITVWNVARGWSISTYVLTIIAWKWIMKGRLYTSLCLHSILRFFFVLSRLRQFVRKVYYTRYQVPFYFWRIKLARKYSKCQIYYVTEYRIYHKLLFTVTYIFPVDVIMMPFNTAISYKSIQQMFSNFYVFS